MESVPVFGECLLEWVRVWYISGEEASYCSLVLIFCGHETKNGEKNLGQIKPRGWICFYRNQSEIVGYRQLH